MDIEQVRECALSFLGVTEDMPFGDDFVTFRIEGKIFVCLCLSTDRPWFALKLPPDRNEELRAQYDGITPAWHWNKRHWSDIYYGQFDYGQVADWMKEAYDLIISGLPKAIRANYQTT